MKSATNLIHMIDKTKQPRFQVDPEVVRLWKEILAFVSIEDLSARIPTSSRTIKNAIASPAYATIEMQKAITEALAAIKRECEAELKEVSKAQVKALKSA